MVRLVHLLLLVIVCSIIFSGCVSDAPHENPFDPLSPSYRGTATLKGIVTVRDKPQVPLSDVWVQVNPQRIGTKSNDDGSFTIDNILAGNIQVLFYRELFTPETISIQLNVGEERQLNVAMNGVPTIISARILTRRVDGQEPIYFVDVRANVTDPNGVNDIDSVWFAVEDDLYSMEFNIGNKLFEVRIESSVLPIDYLIGKQLYVLARDRYGAEGISYPFAVAQPIEVAATPISPRNGDTVSVPLEFRWSAPSISFNYSYSLTIARVHGSGAGQIVIWKTTVEPIRSDQTVYVYTSSLPAGRYSWSISIVDVNGNWSQSVEVPFVVR